MNKYFGRGSIEIVCLLKRELLMTVWCYERLLSSKLTLTGQVSRVMLPHEHCRS